jgi:peptidoglycan/xylan/chitin deacetylase (PgdA/CDA1 family)
LTYPHLTLNQVRELSAAGWTIGSHTKSHKCLIGMNRHQLMNELEESKKKLEDLTGKAIEYLVPPFGRADWRVINSALDCGYKKILLPLTFRKHNFPERNCLYRWNVYSIETNKAFTKRLTDVQLTFQLAKQMVISFCNNASIAANSIK